MREYDRLASRVALFISVSSLVIQLLAQEFLSGKLLSFGAKLFIAVTFGIIVFLIMEWLPRLLLKDKSLCGLYFIIYAGARNNLCSVVNIDYDNVLMSYAIDVYDCCQKNSIWLAIPNQYPHSLDNVYYDLQSRGIHLISNDKNKNTCFFINFINKNKLAKILRYGRFKPFDKPLSGDLKKLTTQELCTVYNEGFNDPEFCNIRIGGLQDCKNKNRQGCKKDDGEILQRVRNKSRYTEIPKALYNQFIANQEPIDSDQKKIKGNMK